MDWAGWLPIIFSVVALLVSLATAWATWIAPSSAARLAENLRSASARADRRDELKRQVFLTLMGERAAPFTENAARAFNTIDVVFVDATTVRNCWAKYLDAMEPQHQVQPLQQRQLLADLLSAMAANLGLTGIGFNDMTRIYSPTYLIRRINIETATQTLQEQELARIMSQASANTTPTTTGTPAPPRE
jgi:hypothetical protein